MWMNKLTTLISLETLFLTLLFSYIIFDMGLIVFSLAITGLIAISFLLYVAVMKLQELKDLGKLTWKHWTIGIPVLIVGIILDVILNVIVGSLLFKELPREFLFTARLDRQGRNGSKIAQWICRFILNPFDEGHCYDGK